ncbi:porin [Pendulispora rubella]|uniref:Porin n=1 Tax=Pendulispora rubella TaxID=2741070 RepID=A0ABZ2LHV1_9BACT
MTRLKWLHLTQLVAAMTTVSVAAAAADDPPAPSPSSSDGKQVAQTTPQPTPEANPEQVPPPPAAPPEATQAVPPPAAPPPTSAAPAAADEEKLPPGSFKVPGTQTVLTLSGYAQLDVTFDAKGRDPQVEDNDWAVHAAIHPLNQSYETRQKSGQLYLTARTSRVGISTMTKSEIADIGAKVEGDFNAGNLLSGQTFTNSVLFRLRHAYGTLSGKYGTFLFGQSWSTMLDLPSYAETVDFNGPGSIPLIRQPQVRYTIPIGDAVSLAVAAENGPGTDRNGVTDSTGPTRRMQQIPDLIAVLGFKGDWGTASVGGVALQYKQAGSPATGGATPTAERDGYSKEGWGVRAGAAINLPWGDRFRAYGAGGNGIGRYIFNAGLQGQGARPNAADDDWQLWQVVAYHVNYTRVWSPVVRSNVVWSQTYMKWNGSQSLAEIGALPSFDGATGYVKDPGFNKRLDQLFINTFFTLNKQVEFGVEYAFSERNTFGNDDAPNSSCDANSQGACASQKGTQHRVTGTMHVNFF